MTKKRTTAPPDSNRDGALPASSPVISEQEFPVVNDSESEATSVIGHPTSDIPSPTSPRVLVIPYLASKANGSELILAIRAWEKHFADLGKVVIIGDLPPQLKGKVTHIPHRAESVNPQVDVAQKMAAAIASELIPDTFIWSNDDIFPLAPLTFEDIAAKKCMITGLKNRGKANGIYMENAERTIEALAKTGITDPKDYATHTPVVFEKAKLAETLAKFKCTQEGHLVSTLYFNRHYPLARPISMDNTAAGTVVASVWKENPDRAILERVLEYKQYLNCNHLGYPHVERHLLRLFPKKSKFEN